MVVVVLVCCQLKVLFLLYKFQTSVLSAGGIKSTKARRHSVVRSIGSLLPLRPLKRVHFHVCVCYFCRTMHRFLLLIINMN